MKRSFKTLLLCSAIVALGGFARSYAPFPSVTDLEAQLQLRHGVPLPRVVQGSDGTMFRVYYIEGRSRGNGYYDAVLRLVR